MKFISKKYLRRLSPHLSKSAGRTRQILSVNPTLITDHKDSKTVSVYVFDYNEQVLEERKLESINDCFPYNNNSRMTWINIDGIRKPDVETLCEKFGIHQLVVDDILSVNHRPKMDEIDNGIFCLLNMLYYNEETSSVEQEQVSIVMGRDYIISFQEDTKRDVFGAVRDKLRMPNSKIRQRSIDYLCYTMIDVIVDKYFEVMEKLGETIEGVEDEVLRGNNPMALALITHMRKEIIILKRNFTPVRELVNSFLHSDSDLLDERTVKYFKDVYSHLVQAIDLVENYRDIMMSLQDLHLNNINLRMNEVMKVLAIVTCLLAPATVIGGVFGMNFLRIPLTQNPLGFWIALGSMLLIPAWMLVVFRKKGWF